MNILYDIVVVWKILNRFFRLVKTSELNILKLYNNQIESVFTPMIDSCSLHN